jgi:UDP-glucose 4-epimerase
MAALGVFPVRTGSSHIPPTQMLPPGNRDAVRWGEVIEADLQDPSSLQHAFEGRHFDAVMHFCARSQVGEAMTQPHDYYANNVVGTLNLLQVMRANDVQRLVFSSTAVRAASERAHRRGASEGADQSAWRQRTDGGTHSGRCRGGVRVALGGVALFQCGGRECGRRHRRVAPARDASDPERPARGNGPWPGTAGVWRRLPDAGWHLRARLHPCRWPGAARQLALDFLDREPGAHVYNLGNGRRLSVREVLQSAGKIVGRPIAHTLAPRRAGDPAVLVAASDKARRELGWAPVYIESSKIIETAWRWHQSPRF